MKLASLFNKKYKIGPFSNFAKIDFVKSFLLMLIIWLPLKEWSLVSSLPGNWQGLVAPVLVLFVLLSMFVFRGIKFRLGKIEISFIVFLFIVAISSLLSVAIYRQTGAVIKDFAVIVELFILYIIGTNLNEEDLGFVLKFGALEAVLIALFGIWQYWVRVPINPLWIIPGESLRARSFATFYTPNGLASYLLIWIWVTFGLAYKNKKWLLFLPILLLAIFFTYSRSAWLGLSVGALILLAINYKKISKKIILIMLAGWTLSVAFFYKRIISIFSSNYGYYSGEAGRVWAFKNVFHILPDHLFYGVGPGLYGGSTAARIPSPVYLESIQHGFVASYLTDNQYLQILITNGIWGGLSYMALFISITLRLLSQVKRNMVFALPMAGIWIGYSVQGFFENIWYIQAAATIVWLFIGFNSGEEK